MARYSSADVARHLGVSRAAITQWTSRGEDIPTPDEVAASGRVYWHSLKEWEEWHAHRELIKGIKKDRKQQLRLRVLRAQLEKIQAEIVDIEELLAGKQ